MHDKIYKIQLEITDEQIISLPENSKILSVKTQRNKPCLWYSFNSKMVQNKPIKLVTIDTGGRCKIESNYEFIGSYFIENDALVFHIFRVQE